MPNTASDAGPRWVRWLPAAVFAVATVVFLWPAISTGGTFAATDILSFASPYREAVASPTPAGNPLQSDQVSQLPLVAEFWQGVRDGELQLWEPDQAGGIPLFTGVHNRVLVPWFAVFAVVPAALAPTVAMAIGLLVGQAGAYLLARRLGLSRPAATLAGVAYVFSGPVTALILRIHEALLAPALLWAVHGAVTSRRRRGRFVAGLAAITAATWFCGFPAAALFNLYAAVAFIGVLAWRATPTVAPGWRQAAGRARGALRRAAAPGMALGAGTAVAAVQLAPTFEFLSTAGGLGRTLPIWHAAGIVKAATAVSGRFFGTYQFRDWWWPRAGYSNPVEASATAGLVVLALVAVVVVWRGGTGPSGDDRLARADRLLGGFFLPLGLVVGIGVFLGGAVLAAVHVLPFMATNSLGRARYLLALVLALVAAYGLDLLVVRWRSRRRASQVRDGEPTAASARSADGVVSPAVRLQAGVILAAIAYGLYRGLAVAHREQVIGQALGSLVVPAVALGGAAVVAGTVALLGARRVRRRGWVWAVALVVVAAAGGELLWGAWGFTPASPGRWFYPDSPAFQAITAGGSGDGAATDGGGSDAAGGVGPGGAWRFVATDPRVLPSHTAAYRDLNDVRAEYPVYGPFEQLLRTADPGLPDDAYKVVLVPDFSDQLAVDSPILDAMSTRFLIDPLLAPPRQLADPVRTPGETGRLPAEMSLPVPAGGIRAVRLSVAPVGCDTGRVQLTVGEHTSRRLLRDTHGPTWFTFPDIAPSTAAATGDGGATGTVDARLTTQDTGDCGATLLESPASVAAPAADTDLELVSTDGWAVYRRQTAPRPRAELAETIVAIEDAQARLDYLSRRPDGGPVVVSGSPAPSDDVELAGGDADIVVDTADRVVVEVEAHGPGLLVLRDVAAPGWHAAVDGQPAQIATADHAFRGVDVPAGTSTVTFTYRPATYVAGAGASLFGLLATAALAWWAHRESVR